MSATVTDKKESPEATEALEPAPRKRGRPKGAKNKPKEPAGTASSYYSQPFPGRVKFLLGIKTHGPSGIPFAHHCLVAGLRFQRLSQKPYAHDEDGQLWSRLSKPGSFGLVNQITFSQVERFAEGLRHWVFRPRYIGEVEIDPKTGRATNRAAAFRVIDLRASSHHYDPKQKEDVPGTPLYRPTAYDIPASECLVLMRVADARQSGRSDRKLPTVAEQDPSLAGIPPEYQIEPPMMASGQDVDDFEDW